MNDLAAWLLEQVAEDERAARGVRFHVWTGDELVEAVPPGAWPAARVLAECEAKRRIVALTVGDGSREFVTVVDMEDQIDSEWGVSTDPQAYNYVYVSDALLRALAAPYADRPGYLDEWRPAVGAS